jgi:hypothetical protein
MDRIAFLSALNPRADHYRFLATRGVDQESVRRAIYYTAVYQSIMRTSSRNPGSASQKTVIVPDVGAARYLQEKIPGATIERLESKHLERIKTAGRPRKYLSNGDRQAAYRRRKKQSKSERISPVQEFPYSLENSCCYEEATEVCYEKDIDLISHFVTHDDLHGTLYRDKQSSDPLGYLACESLEPFIEFLEDLHSQAQPNKEANCLISPAIFGPNKSEAIGKTKRGLNNIVAMRHLWMDFEKGELKPEQVAELFPTIRLVVFNTYNHTNQAPRFRVVIPFDRPISCEDYTTLYDNVIAKIVDAGYCVGKTKGSRACSSLTIYRPFVRAAVKVPVMPGFRCRIGS